MKAILFDLDGTLIDSFEGIAKSAQYALAAYGIEVTDLERFRVFVGPPLIHSFMTQYDFDREKAVEATDKYRERYHVKGIYECTLYPGVAECIQALKKDGYLIGLASSKPEVSCRRILEHFGILELFDEVVGSTLDAKIDTKEEVLNEFLRRQPSLTPNQVCLVGDTIYDVEGANAVGMPSIVVSFGFGDVKQMLEGGARAVVDSLAQLPVCIARLFPQETDTQKVFMSEAVREAYEGIARKHGGPFGCVIVKDNIIIGRGHNQVLDLHDPTCHGEVMAIRDACKNLNTHDLTGCDLYTTAAPCPMCKGAMLWANIKNVYYGCTTEDTDGIGFRDEVFYANWNQSKGHDYGTQLGQEECRKLFADYASGTHELY